MTNKILNIFINIILLISFLLTYFLDLTGLDWHQYLGVGVGIFLVIHILTHMKWIYKVTSRFFSKMSTRVRVNYILDILLLIVIATIIGSGIAISTWLTISFELYPLIRYLHIILSIAGLSLLVVKLGYHWKYFVNLKKRIPILNIPFKAPMQAVPAKNISRREALITISTFSTVGIFGLYKAMGALSPAENNANLPDPQVASISLGTGNNSKNNLEAPSAINNSTISPESADSISTETGHRNRRGRGGSLSNDQINEGNLPQNVLPAEQPAAPIPVAPTEEPAIDTCVVRCPRGCAFPGQCRRYIDENGNDLCDLGECLVL